VRFVGRRLWPKRRLVAQGPLSQLIAQTAVDPELLARELRVLPPAAYRYAIFFVGRSGSTWLADLLSRQRDLGKPREYLNTKLIGRFAAEMNAGTVADYLALLRRKRITPNGVFGLKINASQVSTLLAELPFAEAFPDHVWFYLRRRNLVAQAISGYKAMVSGLYQLRRTDLPAERHRLESAHALIGYDAKAIGRHVASIVEMEKLGERLMAQFAILPIRLIYEDMLIARPADVVSMVRRRVLGVGPPVDADVKSSNIEKFGDSRNLDFEERFRRDEALLIRRLESERPPLQSTAIT
jgi:LPS sulfotransferase NodH